MSSSFSKQCLLLYNSPANARCNNAWNRSSSRWRLRACCACNARTSATRAANSRWSVRGGRGNSMDRSSWALIFACPIAPRAISAKRRFIKGKFISVVKCCGCSLPRSKRMRMKYDAATASKRPSHIPVLPTSSRLFVRLNSTSPTWSKYFPRSSSLNSTYFKELGRTIRFRLHCPSAGLQFLYLHRSLCRSFHIRTRSKGRQHEHAPNSSGSSQDRQTFR